jgi:hypothetical protein
VDSLPSGPVAGYGEVSMRVVGHLPGRLASIVQDLQILFTVVLVHMLTVNRRPDTYKNTVSLLIANECHL